MVDSGSLSASKSIKSSSNAESAQLLWVNPGTWKVHCRIPFQFSVKKLFESSALEFDFLFDHEKGWAACNFVLSIHPTLRCMANCLFPLHDQRVFP